MRSSRLRRSPPHVVVCHVVCASPDSALLRLYARRRRYIRAEAAARRAERRFFID